MSRTFNPLLRFHIRGLEIDAQCGKGSVVNLIVRANKKHEGAVGRLRQHIANALFCAADACHPSYDNGGLRVVLCDMPAASLNDGLPDRTDPNVRDVWPIKTANGDAHYIALLVHEGVKRHQDGRPVTRNGMKFWRQKSADDSHGGAPGVLSASTVSDAGGAA